MRPIGAQLSTVRAVAGLGAALRGLAGFHLGVMLGWLSPQLRRSWATPASLLAAAGFVAGSVLGSPAALTLSAAVLIFTLSADRGPVAWLLAMRGTVWLGRVSFSIYLLHAPLLTLLQRIPVPGGNWGHLMLFLAILLPMSELTYRWIEQPGRRIPALLRRLLPPFLASFNVLRRLQSRSAPSQPSETAFRLRIYLVLSWKMSAEDRTIGIVDRRK